MEDKKCPKCQGIMEKGIFMNNMGDIKWQKGEINKILLNTKQGFKVIAYACSNCGNIENFVEQ